MTYADLNGDGEVTPTEIIEENNYYPFGLRHQGYNELATDAHQYKFLDREYQPELGLNTIATDYRHYDPAIGRFNVMDAMSELAPGQTPYRYGFNNPVNWTDPTGLFETYEAAEAFALNKLGLERDSYSISNDGFGGYILTVEGGEFDGQEFYNSTRLHELEELVIEVNTHGSKGGSSDDGNSLFQGSGSTDFERLWNSPIMRFVVPDKISFGLAGEWAYYIGVDVSTFNFTILTRGEAGIYLTPYFSGRIGVGSYVSGGVNFSTGYFTGNPNNITASMLEGHTAGAVLSGVFIGKASVGGSYSFTDKRGIGFINSEVGIGLGVGPAAGAGGFGGIQYQYTPAYGTIWKWY